MKKLLIVFVLTLFSSTSFAVILTGTISDQISSEGIEGAEISLTEDPPENGSFYKISDFSVDNTDDIIFKKDGYEDLTGHFSYKKIDNNIFHRLYFYNNTTKSEILVDVETPEDSHSESCDDSQCSLEDNKTVYTLDIQMIPEKKKGIISGIVTGMDGETLENVKVSYTDIEINGHTFSDNDKTDDNGRYKLNGYFSPDGENILYDLKFEHTLYQKKELSKIEVKNKPISEKDLEKLSFQLTELSDIGKREKNLQDLTQRRCEDTMPKYLVGASCGENMELKGDASDIAIWIQKFGGKITSLISMIAVLLIVWNAFNLATAAGDSDKISQGKKGILWTILGLALTMFAYIIVKTVIALTYTT